MNGDNGKVRSDNWEYLLDGDTRAISNGLNPAFGQARQHIQGPRDSLRYSFLRWKVGLFCIPVQRGYNIRYWTSQLGQDQNIHVPKAACVSQEMHNGTFAGIPEKNAHPNVLLL